VPIPRVLFCCVWLFERLWIHQPVRKHTTSGRKWERRDYHAVLCQLPMVSQRWFCFFFPACEYVVAPFYFIRFGISKQKKNFSFSRIQISGGKKGSDDHPGGGFFFRCFLVSTRSLTIKKTNKSKQWPARTACNFNPGDIVLLKYSPPTNKTFIFLFIYLQSRHFSFFLLQCNWLLFQ
jgi:hypothetical protein